MRDGRDLVEWIAGQPWGNGKIGAVGGSYTGFTALAAAASSPQVDVVFADAPAESEAWALSGGTVNTNTLSWLNLVASGEWLPASATQQATNTLTPGGLDQALLGRSVPLWQEIIAAPHPDAPFWTEYGLRGHYDSVCVPVVVVDNGEQTAQIVWDHLRREGCMPSRSDYHYFVAPGPHTHLLADILSGVESRTTRLITDYLGHHLKGSPAADPLTSPVYYRAHDESDDLVKAVDAFPPVQSEELVLFLAESNALATVAPSESQAFDEWAVDPERTDPCAEDHSLAFTSAPLLGEFLLVGNPEAEFYLSTSGRDADLFVTVADDIGTPITSGHARARYRDGAVPHSLEPGVPVSMTLSFAATVAQHLVAGTRLTLSIRGASCEYLENPHTGDPLNRQDRWQQAVHRLYRDSSRPSKLRLQVIRL